MGGVQPTPQSAATSSCPATAARAGAQGVRDPALFPPSAALAEPLGGEAQLLPTRRVDVDGASFSTVLRGPAVCHPNAPLEFHTLSAPRRGAAAGERQARRPVPPALVPPCLQARPARQLDSTRHAPGVRALSPWCECASRPPLRRKQRRAGRRGQRWGHSEHA